MAPRCAAPPGEVGSAQRRRAVLGAPRDGQGSAWWIVVLAGAVPAEPGGVPWPALLAVLALLVMAAAIYASTIARPVRELARATRRVGEAWPAPVPLRGPRELRELALGFDAMLQRLQQVEDERQVLIGGLPHDLRAPLARLRLRLAMLPPGVETSGLAGDLASIERIVRQFNDYLQGGPEPETARRTLVDVVEQAVEPYRSLGRAIRSELDGGEAATVPPLALRRILDNLLDNAFRHGSEPVVLRARSLGRGEVELRVTDAGGGIPAAAGERALEPFTKLDPARGQAGCGLGLAIVRQLARQLGGQVRFEGGAGAFTVVVRLQVPPVVVAPAVGKAPALAPATGTGTAQAIVAAMALWVAAMPAAHAMAGERGGGGGAPPPATDRAPAGGGCPRGPESGARGSRGRRGGG